MGIFLFPFIKEYSKSFGGKPFQVGEDSSVADSNSYTIQEQAQARLQYTEKGSQLITDYLGREVWLPIRFFELDPSIFTNGELLLPFATIQVSMKKNFVKTPLAQRKGTVKELYSIDDYDVQIKGFLIDIQGRSFPEKQLEEMKNLFETNEAIAIDNAITNIFLPEDEDTFRRVVIEGLEFPEVSGGKKHVRPFAMKLESDIVFTLEDE